MKNIGLFGSNLQAATQKVLQAKTPAEKKFRTDLISNDKAREVVDQVEFVKSRMEALDDGKHDQNKASGTVQVDAQANQLKSFKRRNPGLASDLDAITTKAPEGQTAPTVKGELKDGNLQLEVRHPDKTETFGKGSDSFEATTAEGGKTTFALTNKEDGSVVYRAGSDVVTMNPDGTLSMSVVEGDKTPTPPRGDDSMGALDRGINSAGTVLQRAMTDAAGFGNKVGKKLGVDETAPGIKGAIGTTISLGTSLIGGLVALPLATIAGVADALG